MLQIYLLIALSTIHEPLVEVLTTKGRGLFLSKTWNLGKLPLFLFMSHRTMCYHQLFFEAFSNWYPSSPVNSDKVLRVLQTHDLKREELHFVARATTVASILYAISAW